MKRDTDLEIFLVAVPGLEAALLREVKEQGFNEPKSDFGGITTHGTWQDIWRANLVLRGASRVLVRIDAFRVQHLAKLDKLARRFDWQSYLRPDVPVRVDVSCKKSKIYHQKAAAQRFETALKEEVGITISADAEVCLKVRIIEDLCTISIDTSGEGLYKRGHKQAVNKAPLRETLAALLLRQCGYDGRHPVVDPMCGSGTFAIEAAEMAVGLNPGRARSFAFEQLATFDESEWSALKETVKLSEPKSRFYGFDRDKGAIKMSTANAERAGVSDFCKFEHRVISDLTAPEGPVGLVIINPPYGARIGDVKKLLPLYQSLGKVLKDRFPGWRVGLVTNSDALAKATALPFFKKAQAFSHGGIKVKLYKTKPL